MPTAAAAPAVESAHVRQYGDEGYTVVRGLVPRERALAMRDHVMRLRAEGPKPGDMGGDPRDAKDPLNAFPRMINMHGWDHPSAAWASDPALLAAVAALIGQRPVLNQTMVYFKPPGARGQALHQDMQYITKTPLIGAWCALDRSDEAVGRMVVVPASHRVGLLPVRPADPGTSFTNGGTVIPEGAREQGLDMEPGDMLFFAGGTIHGSYPNTTRDRFRRCFITHFVGDRAEDFVPPPGTHMTHLAP